MDPSEDKNLEEERKVSKPLTSKSIYTDRIVKEIIKSGDKVDKRLLKLHKISENSRTATTDLISYLGVKASLTKRLSISEPQPLPESVKKDELPSE